MSNKGLSKTEARRTVRLIEKYLKQGFKPQGISLKKGELGAIAMAAREMGEATNTIISRVNPNGSCARSGYGVDWSLYKPKITEAPKTTEPEKNTNHEIERKLTALRDENAELRRKLQDSYRDALDSDAIRQILGGIVSTPARSPDWILETHKANPKDPEVPITLWSDWHAGEVVSLSETNGINSFDLNIFEQRVKRLVDRTIILCRDHGPGNYPGIVINILGDMCSGALHPELAKTDEEEIIPCVLRVRDILVWSLDRMIEFFGNVYCPCTSGNHGRNTLKPEFKRYVYKNFDWLIYQLLARHYSNRKEIVFDIPDSNEVLYRVYNQRYLAMHGDQLGTKGGDGIIGLLGPVSRGEFKVGKQAEAIGRGYDMLLMGHWHYPLWLPRIIVNGTLKGWDEYAQKALRAPPTLPSQQLWFVHPKYGKTAAREVLLEDPIADPNPNWVSYLGSAA